MSDVVQPFLGDALVPVSRLRGRMKAEAWDYLQKANKELWLVFSLFGIAGVLNLLVSSQHMVLAFYTLPTVFSAYWYGRRHATLTAFASVLLVVLVAYVNPLGLANATRTRE